MQKMTQEDIQKSSGQLHVLFMTPARASQIFSYVYGETITEQQVRDIAAAADILRPDDTFSLLHYCAFLVKENKNGD